MKETVSTVFDGLEIGITLHDPETGTSSRTPSGTAQCATGQRPVTFAGAMLL